MGRGMVVTLTVCPFKRRVRLSHYCADVQNIALQFLVGSELMAVE